MADARQLLVEALATLDAARMLEHHEVNKALEPVGMAAKESGEKIDELRFEFIAAYLALYDEPNVWGTHYGPEMAGIDSDGNRVDMPPLEMITPECTAYWTARMHAARHPTLRARYADMVWDLSQKATGTKPPIDTVRIAIDGYSEALTTYPKTSFHSWGNIPKRIIGLALSICDEGRLQKSVAACIAFANTDVAADESDFRHQVLFKLLMSVPPRRRPKVEFQAFVDQFRTRLEALDVAEADQFRVEHYALPLACYYWSSKQPEEAKAVMLMYGAAVERMAATATMPALAVGWLKRLYELFLRFQMNDEAKHVLKRIEELQPLVPNDFVSISTSQKISQEELDEWLNWLVTDDIEESFAKLTGHFLPRLEQLRRQLEEFKRDFPLSQMFAATLVHHDGRAVAEIDSEDAEGKLLRHMFQQLQLRSTFLQLGMERLFAKHAVGPSELFARVVESPIWHENRHAILRRGIEAYFANDPIAAIHILVTEVENAVRIVAAGLGIARQKPNRMGGFDLKNLGDFLVDETIAAFLTEDVVMYLRVMLTDRRGWNLRNNVCHGILPAAEFTQTASRQLLHIILLLSEVCTHPKK